LSQQRNDKISTNMKNHIEGGFAMKRKEAADCNSTLRGFTRVDLMACIAAVAVLSALGASAISSSKDNVSRIVCASNMRQLALAVGTYACDHQDYLAYCNWDGGDADDPYPGWLYTLPVPLGLTGAHMDRIPDPFTPPWSTNNTASVTGLPDSAWESGAYFPYVKKHLSYLCPVDIQSPDWSAEPQGANGPGRNNKLSSYLMNAASCNFGGQPAICKVSDVWSPDCYLLWEVDEHLALSEGQTGAFLFNDGGNSPDAPPAGAEGLGAIHGNNSGEVLTVGGNVTFIALSAFTVQSRYHGAGPDGRSLAWWAPNLISGGWLTH
jgi:hypothetical protein